MKNVDQILQDVSTTMAAQGPVRVLLVDHDPAALHVVSVLLGRNGYEITTTSTGADATDLIAVQRPQVVIVAQELPDTTGLDVVRVGRERSPASEFILLTAHGSVESAVEAMDEGAFAYVTKPFKDLHDLVQKVDAAVAKTAMTLENQTLLEKLRRACTEVEKAQIEVDMMSDVLREKLARHDAAVRAEFDDLRHFLVNLESCVADLTVRDASPAGNIPVARHELSTLRALVGSAQAQAEAFDRKLGAVASETGTLAGAPTPVEAFTPRLGRRPPEIARSPP